MALPASATPAPAVRVADVVLIPAKASAFDVWAATDIVAAVKARKQSSKGIPRAAFVITMAKPRTLPGRQMDAALAELGLPVLEARTTVRVAYTYAGNQGTSVRGRARTGPHAMRSSPYATSCTESPTPDSPRPASPSLWPWLIATGATVQENRVHNPTTK